MKSKGGRGLDDRSWEQILGYFDAMANGLDETGEILYEDENGIRWKFIVIFGQGDLEQLCQQWGVVSYNGEHEMCGCCLANRTTMQFTNLQENAEWRPTCPLSNEASRSVRVSAHQNKFA